MTPERRKAMQKTERKVDNMRGLRARLRSKRYQKSTMRRNIGITLKRRKDDPKMGGSRLEGTSTGIRSGGKGKWALRQSWIQSSEHTRKVIEGIFPLSYASDFRGIQWLPSLPLLPSLRIQTPSLCYYYHTFPSSLQWLQPLLSPMPFPTCNLSLLELFSWYASPSSS